MLACLLAPSLAGCLEPSIDDDLDLTVQVIHLHEADTGDEGEPRPDSVYVSVEGAEHDGHTDPSGEVRFHELPPGLANVTVLTRRYGEPQMQSQAIAVGGEPATVSFRFPA